MQHRLAQIDESIVRYLSQPDSADRQGTQYRRPRSPGSTRRLRRCVRKYNPERSEQFDDADRGQADLTADSDARSTAASGRGARIDLIGRLAHPIDPLLPP